MSWRQLLRAQLIAATYLLECLRRFPRHCFVRRSYASSSIRNECVFHCISLYVESVFSYHEDLLIMLRLLLLYFNIIYNRNAKNISSIELMSLSIISSTTVFIDSKSFTSDQLFSKCLQTWLIAYWTGPSCRRYSRQQTTQCPHSLTTLYTSGALCKVRLSCIRVCWRAGLAIASYCWAHAQQTCNRPMQMCQAL